MSGASSSGASGQRGLFSDTLAQRMRLDAELRRDGVRKLAGIDEAGRGPLAGPVVAAIASITPGTSLPGLDDSKRLTEKNRERLFQLLYNARGTRVSFGIGRTSAGEIDELGIRPATFLAMERAVHDWSASQAEALDDYLLVIDGRDMIPGLRHLRQIAVIKADGRSRNVAAASVLAKVTRDRELVTLSRSYPEYGFEQHKGYGTRGHMSVLKTLGPTPIHRTSFEPIKSMLGNTSSDR